MRKNFLLKLLLAALIFGCPHSVRAGGVTATYLYNLSNFTGTVPYYWGRIYLDNPQKEVYVTTASAVDIFNQSGMEVYHFMTESGAIQDVGVEPSGDLLLLVRAVGGSEVRRCDYRGDFKETVRFYGLPTIFKKNLNANRMVYRNGLIYLADTASMKVVVFDSDGSFVRGYDIGALLQYSERERADSGLSGFNVGNDGSIMYTLASEGWAGIINEEGGGHTFGKRGSGPGKFGVPAAIIEDRMGNILVTDKLRSVVVVFDKNLRFIKEFGYRGLAPGNLVVPHDIAIDDLDRVYVSQLRGRGVSVYQLRYE